MKPAKIAILVLILLFSAVFANSIYISTVTERLAEKVKDVEIDDLDYAMEKFEILREEFKKAEKYISITVSHDDLTNIEEGFADIIGAARSGMRANVITIKSRLEDSLKHLGRLSSLNLESII